MNPFEMVAVIVVVVTIGRVLQARYGVGRDRKGNEFSLRDDGTTQAENQRLREELRALKDRGGVLDRLATENDTSGARLDREIEKLRDRT